MTWNVAETLDFVERQHGKPLSELAGASLHSAEQRLRFARYHFGEATDLLTKFSSEAPDMRQPCCG